MIEIVDTHCHLDFEENDNDINEVIQRANKNNVEYLVSISVNLNNFDKINSIDEKYENIWCTTGIHPNYVFDEKRSIEKVYQEIEKNISHKKVIGLAQKVEKQSNIYKKQLLKCKNSLNKKKYIIF